MNPHYIIYKCKSHWRVEQRSKQPNAFGERLVLFTKHQSKNAALLSLANGGSKNAATYDVFKANGEHHYSGVFAVCEASDV